MLHDRQTVSMPSGNVGGTPVDVSLVLAADCSGSISNEDLTLQFHGYAEAITSDTVINAVRSGWHGQIALTFVTWSSAGRQDQALPWTLIDDISSACRFASALWRMRGPIPGYTSISGVIDFAARLLSTCDFQSARRVIDVSGDGRNNDGRSVTDARDDAVVAGITINGLPIVRHEPDIVHYYSQNVIGGPGAFVIGAQDIGSFDSAIQEKLVTEIVARQGNRGNIRLSVPGDSDGCDSSEVRRIRHDRYQQYRAGRSRRAATACATGARLSEG